MPVVKQVTRLSAPVPATTAQARRWLGSPDSKQPRAFLKLIHRCPAVAWAHIQVHVYRPIRNDGSLANGRTKPVWNIIGRMVDRTILVVEPKSRVLRVDEGGDDCRGWILSKGGRVIRPKSKRDVGIGLSGSLATHRKPIPVRPVRP